MNSMIPRTSMLKPKLIKKMMAESEKKIRVEKESINAINVFPVPDGDTGANMYFTIKKIVEEVQNVTDEEKILSAINRGAFLGAKGNSGVIYSQFLIGVVESLEEQQKITISSFSKGFAQGVEYAYDAVMNPVEGTILTVIRKVSEKAAEIADRNEEIGWIEFFDALIETAYKALKETQDQLEVLKDAGVVDAGAKGFVHILESWRKALE
ncbi:MAG: DAK2 domain-containing protein [Candidatus Heimdallarchaeum endolithica]|uniref:DAK2 domain-containing protein n=1 Tax=Candidatus Heimdallarchaeum endolithica TaxID=2876572 RepID=A0A9Y1BS34_9ARCH|nr:MAG: DAK2 domain-containing protein [Candidatus Heimdallarchaeum endolithica]